MVTKSVFSESPLALFKNGHPKNVRNPILESLSHAEIHEIFNMLGKEYIYFKST